MILEDTFVEKTTYTCDVCGKTKQETNHWFRSAMGQSAFILAQWSFSLDHASCGNPVKEQHLCGAECVRKKLAEYLGIQHQ